jgi:hypothetical protein
MVGKLLQRNKFQLDLEVDLFLAIDEDLLASSEAWIRDVAIINDQATEQMPLDEQVSLLKLIMPLI